MVTGTEEHADRIRRTTRMWGHPYTVVSTPCDPTTGTIHVDALAVALQTHHPALLVLGDSDNDGGAGAPRLVEYDLPAIRRLCDAQNCRLLYDATPVAGLVAGKVFQADLLEYSDMAVVRQPYSLHAPGDVGLILYSQHYPVSNSRSSSIVVEAAAASPPEQQPVVAHPSHPSNSSSSSDYQTLHFHEVAALGMALLEFKAFGANYAQMVVTNTQVLAEKLVKRHFVVLPAVADRPDDYSHSHELVLDLGSNGLTAAEAIQSLAVVNIWVAPHVHNSNNNGNNSHLLRLSTAVLTRRGFQPEDMAAVAKALSDIVKKQRATIPTRRYVQTKCINCPAQLAFTFPSEANLAVPNMIAMVRDHDFDDGYSC